MAAAEYRLKVVRSLHDEWTRRRIERHIPALAGHQPGVIAVSAETLQEIEQDARLLLDPTWFDLLPEERRIYRALVAQCGRLKAIGPVEAVA